MRLLVAIVLLRAAVAGAIECAPIAGAAPSLATVDADERLRFLQLGLRRAARQARIWAWSSAGVLTFIASGQLVLAHGAPDPGDRIDLYVGAASMSFSIFQLAAFSPKAMYDQPRLDRRIRLATPDTDHCALLATAEQYLLRDAASEEFGRGPFMHATTIGFGIAVGLLLGIAFDRWISAAINIFVNAAVGELQILTQPTDSVDLLARYRAGRLSAATAERTRLQLAPQLGRDRIGLTLALGF